MLIYPDDRVLVAIMNNAQDWQRVQTEGWYRLPAKHAPEGTPHFDWLAFYFTRAFGSDKWAIHYYARIEGHELLPRRDLLPAEPDHKRAGDWYYKLQIGPIQHKLPPHCLLQLAANHLYCNEGGKTRHELLKLPQLAINLSQLLC